MWSVVHNDADKAAPNDATASRNSPWCSCWHQQVSEVPWLSEESHIKVPDACLWQVHSAIVSVPEMLKSTQLNSTALLLLYSKEQQVLPVFILSGVLKPPMH